MQRSARLDSADISSWASPSRRVSFEGSLITETSLLVSSDKVKEEGP